MYDLYLSHGCRTRPALKSLEARIPELTQPSLQTRLMTLESAGFLGLDLPEDVATQLYQELKAAHARGEVVPSLYRQPQVTREAARQIAERDLLHQQQTAFPGYSFGPVLFLREEGRCWVFVTSSPQLKAEGHIPGAVLAYVDKLDGHVWQQADFARLRQS